MDGTVYIVQKGDTVTRSNLVREDFSYFNEENINFAVPVMLSFQAAAYQFCYINLTTHKQMSGKVCVETL